MPDRKTVIAAIGELLVPRGRGRGPATNVPVESELTLYVVDLWGVEPAVAAAAAWSTVKRIVDDDDASNEGLARPLLAVRLLLGRGELPRTGSDPVPGTAGTFHAACLRAKVEVVEPDFMQSGHRQVMAAATSNHYKSKSAWSRGGPGLVGAARALLDRIDVLLQDTQYRDELLMALEEQLAKPVPDSADHQCRPQPSGSVSSHSMTHWFGSRFTDVPRTLPPARATFINRTAELASVSEHALVARRRAAVVVLGGSQGMGKSSLAERWAHLNTRSFPDGQLYLRMSTGSAEGATSVDEAMGVALQSLGCAPSHLPIGVEARTSLYRTLTADRELLVLLDQVPAPALARPFIPASPRATVLIASSSALDELERLDGAARISVEPLGEVAAIETLRALAGREPLSNDEERSEAEILEYCQGLPLAIELCAALVRDDLESLTSVAESLREESTRLANMRTGADSLSTIFDASYRDLPSNLARGYRLLGASPALPNSLAAAACVLGRSLAESKELLRELRRRHLIRFGATPEFTDGLSIEMHDLLRVHAATASLRFGHRDEAEALAGRLAHFAQAVGRIVDRAVSPERLRVALPPAPQWDDTWGREPSPATGGEADALYARERQLVLSTLRAARPGTDDEAVCRVADSLWPVVYGRRFNSDTSEIYDIASQAAGRLANAAIEARIALLHARGCYIAGDNLAAVDVSDRAISLSKRSSDDLLRAAARGNRAYIAYHCEGAEKALPLFRAAKAEYDPASARGIAIQNYFIGRCLADLDEPEEASEVMAQALAAFEQIGDEILAVRCRSHLAEMSLERDPQEAVELAKQVVLFAEDAGEYSPLARAHRVLAETEPGDRRILHLRAARFAFEMVGDTESVEQIDRRIRAS